MSMIACTECMKKHSDTAVACPHCGARRLKPKLWLWIPLGIVGIFLAFAFLRTSSPEEKEMAHARRAISYCHDQIKEQSVGSGEAEFMINVCKSMEQEFSKKYGVTP